MLGNLTPFKARVPFFGELERELTDLETTSPRPEAPEDARVEEWILEAYRRSWQLFADTPADA